MSLARPDTSAKGPVSMAAVWAQRLIAEDLDPLFGLLGDGNMEFVAEYVEFGGEFVAAHHEATSVGMAGGYSVARDRPAVATVTCGPGLTNATTQLVALERSSTPVVLIAGETPGARYDHFQRLDQSAFVSSLGITYLAVTAGEPTGQTLDRALYHATVAQKPVVVGVPYDLWEKRSNVELATPSQRLSETSVWSGLRGSEDRIRQLADLIRSSSRPILVAGRGCAGDPEAKERLLQLAEQVGALTGTTLLAKGFTAEDRYSIGVVGGFASAEAQRLSNEADLVIFVGSSISDETLGSGQSFVNAKLAAIDLSPAPRFGVADRVACFVQGGASTSLGDLIRELGSYERERWAAPEAPSYDEADLNSHCRQCGRLSPSAVAQSIAKYMHRFDITTVGGAHFWSFPLTHFPGDSGTRYVLPYGFGSIGLALPWAIGATIANSDSHSLLVDGDGGFAMAMQDLDIVGRRGLNLMIVLFDDEALGSEAHKLERAGYPSDLAKTHPPDFSSIAETVGIAGYRAESLGTLQWALETHLSQTGPALVDVKICPHEISPYYRLKFGLGNSVPHVPS